MGVAYREKELVRGFLKLARKTPMDPSTVSDASDSQPKVRGSLKYTKPRASADGTNPALAASQNLPPPSV